MVARSWAGSPIPPDGNFLIVSYEDGAIGPKKINNIDGDLFLIHRLTGDLGGHIRQFEPLPSLYLLPHGSKLRFI